MKQILLASPQMLGNEQKYVKEAFDSNWIAPLGPFVQHLENDFKQLSGKEAVAMSSGTAALHMAVKLAKVKPGDIVFCSSLTFSASVNPVLYEGGTPIFIDSEPNTYNMSPIALKKAFEKYPKPKAVIIVSLYGMPAELDSLLKICAEHNTTVIHDAAESLGSTYKNKPVISYGQYIGISFNGNKIITTSGGGMLLTNNQDEAKLALKWATQSREPARHYEHKEVGYNYRMSNICAAIGCAQLEDLDQKIAKKRQIFDNYAKEFRDIKEISMLAEPNKDMKSTHWLSILKLKENSKITPLDIIEALEKANIESRPIWKPMHLQPIFAKAEFFSHNKNGEVPVCEDLFATGVCLPSDTNMTTDEQEKVINVIKGLFE